MVNPNPSWRGDPTFLPEVLKQFGVRVQEWPGWRDRGHGDFGRIQGIVVHHTGTNTDIPGYIAQHPELGLCSQIHLNRDGTAVLTGVGIAWHAGAGWFTNWPTNAANQVSIGIEAASDGTSPWPPAMLDAYYRCCAAILWFLGKRATPDTLLGHKEYSGAAQGKWDPGGIDMNDFRARVNKYIDNPPFGGKKEETEVDFDRLDRRYRSRVPGSTVDMTPLDALLNADSHAYQTLQVVLSMSSLLKSLNERVEKLEQQKGA